MISEAIIKLPTRIHLHTNPLNCPCIIPLLQKYRKHIIKNYKNKNMELCSSFEITTKNQHCSEQPLTPMGSEQRAEIGELFSLYCVGVLPEDEILWTLPNGSHLLANNSDVRNFFYWQTEICRMSICLQFFKTIFFY